MSVDRNCRSGERSTYVPFVGNVVHAAEVGTGVHAHEIHEHLREVRYATGRRNLNLTQSEIATEKVCQCADCGRIAAALDKHKGTDVDHATCDGDA